MTAPLLPHDTHLEDGHRTAPKRPTLRQLYDRNPFLFLGLVAGAGYIIGGGLLTPFTKRAIKIGTRAFVLPEVIDHFQAGAQNRLK